MSASASPADMVSYQSHYAGAVSRFVAYAIDVAVATAAITPPSLDSLISVSAVEKRARS